MEQKAKVATISSKGQIVIPKEYREALSLSEGDNVVVVSVNGGLFLKKLDQQLLRNLCSRRASN